MALRPLKKKVRDEEKEEIKKAVDRGEYEEVQKERQEEEALSIDEVKDLLKGMLQRMYNFVDMI